MVLRYHLQRTQQLGVRAPTRRPGRGCARAVHLPDGRRQPPGGNRCRHYRGRLTGRNRPPDGDQTQHHELHAEHRHREHARSLTHPETGRLDKQTRGSPLISIIQLICVLDVYTNMYIL